MADWTEIGVNHPLFEDRTAAVGRRVGPDGREYNALALHDGLTFALARVGGQLDDSPTVRYVGSLLHRHCSGSVRSSFAEASHEVLALPGAPRVLTELLKAGPSIRAIEPAELLPSGNTISLWRSGPADAGDASLNLPNHSPDPTTWWGLSCRWSEDGRLYRCVLVRNPARNHRVWACGWHANKLPRKPAALTNLAADVVLHDGAQTHTGARVVADVLRACAGRASVLAVTRVTHLDESTTRLWFIGTRLLPHGLNEASLGSAASAAPSVAGKKAAAVKKTVRFGESIVESLSAVFSSGTVADETKAPDDGAAAEQAGLASKSDVDRRAVAALRVMLRAAPGAGAGILLSYC